jgi:ribokinase
VNQVEARALAGVAADDDVSPPGLARRLSSRGAGRVAITLGAEGALLFDGEKVIREPAPKVAAIDTAGAGDAFVAALVVAHKAAGLRLADSLRIACAAGSLATTVEGAMPSLPHRDDVPGL